MLDDDNELRRINRLLRNFSRKIKLLEELVSKRRDENDEDKRPQKKSYSRKQRDSDWKSLRIIPNITKTDKLFNPRSGTFDGLNLRDHLQALREAYSNILDLNKPSTRFPSLVQLSAKVIGYSIVNYDLSRDDDSDDSDELTKPEREARSIEVVDYIYNCVPAHLRSLLVPSHALSFLFSSETLSSHHPTVSSLLQTTRPHGLEFQDIIHQSLTIAFARSTLPPPDYITEIANKFNAIPELLRSLTKLLPAFEPALSTCRAIDNIRSLPVCDLSPLIQSILSACYQSHIPPFRLRDWLYISNENSLFDAALNKCQPLAQRVLFELAIETTERLLNEPAREEWFTITYNLCSAALIFASRKSYSCDLLCACIDNISKIPFIQRTTSEALSMFDLELLFALDYSRSSVLIDKFDYGNLLPPQLSLLSKVISKGLHVEGIDDTTLHMKKEAAKAKFEKEKIQYLHTSTYKTPQKGKSRVLDLTPASSIIKSNKLTPYLMLPTPRFSQTPFFRRKTQNALAPQRVFGKKFQFHGTNKLYGFGTPVFIQRNWNERYEGDDDDDDEGDSNNNDNDDLDVNLAENDNRKEIENLPALPEDGDSSEYSAEDHSDNGMENESSNGSDDNLEGYESSENPRSPDKPKVKTSKKPQPVRKTKNQKKANSGQRLQNRTKGLRDDTHHLEQKKQKVQKPTSRRVIQTSSEQGSNDDNSLYANKASYHTDTFINEHKNGRDIINVRPKERGKQSITHKKSFDKDDTISKPSRKGKKPIRVESEDSSSEDFDMLTTKKPISKAKEEDNRSRSSNSRDNSSSSEDFDMLTASKPRKQPSLPKPMAKAHIERKNTHIDLHEDDRDREYKERQQRRRKTQEALLRLESFQELKETGYPMHEIHESSTSFARPEKVKPSQSKLRPSLNNALDANKSVNSNNDKKRAIEMSSDVFETDSDDQSHLKRRKSNLNDFMANAKQMDSMAKVANWARESSITVASTALANKSSNQAANTNANTSQNSIMDPPALLRKPLQTENSNGRHSLGSFETVKKPASGHKRPSQKIVRRISNLRKSYPIEISSESETQSLLEDEPPVKTTKTSAKR
ncbi:hypothetical protein E3Q14_01404 [Wallemia mellicola]|nr:hypothetical protein E3Q14_01404 [Wallemia mellicola]